MTAKIKNNNLKNGPSGKPSNVLHLSDFLSKLRGNYGINITIPIDNDGDIDSSDFNLDELLDKYNTKRTESNCSVKDIAYVRGRSYPEGSKDISSYLIADFGFAQNSEKETIESFFNNLSSRSRYEPIGVISEGDNLTDTIELFELQFS